MTLSMFEAATFLGDPAVRRNVLRGGQCLRLPEAEERGISASTSPPVKGTPVRNHSALSSRISGMVPARGTPAACCAPSDVSRSAAGTEAISHLDNRTS